MASENSSHTDERPNELVLFDLDQTIFPWDMQLVFANWVVQRERWRIFYLILFLPLVPFAKMLGAGRMKRVFLSLVWGMSEEKIQNVAEEFAQHYVGHDERAGFGYPLVLERLREHQSAGRMTILTSASPEIYVSRIGELLKFDHAFGTKFTWGGLFPKLMGGNHKSAAKVERLKAEGIWAGPEDAKTVFIEGFSDSSADLPMLELCERVTCVNPNEKLMERAQEKGWEIIQPERPFRGQAGFVWACVRQLIGCYSREAGRNGGAK